MADHSDAVESFPLYEARALVRDLMTPKPWIYWADFLFHISLGWSALVIMLHTSWWSIWQVCAYFIAVIAFYRAAIFIHELAHLARGTFRLFRIVWNVTCGIPFMIPSFTYDGVHHDHHKPGVYGTAEDGEYLPFARQRPAAMVGYVLLSVILPLLLVMRFLVLTPLSYLIPALRKVVWERASSLTINPAYIRSRDAIRNDHDWRIQEFVTFLFVSVVIASVIFGILPYQLLLVWYSIAVTVFILNSLRTLAAHAYRHSGARSLTLAEQYLDSVNIPGNWFTSLWAPVGLRYHATHHLFMSLPYHNLGEAQRRLSQKLGDHCLILQTSRKGLWDALKRIWREAAAAKPAKE
ncbi:fatty acid desaturase family protein [Nitrosomonas sp. ANs5]|uniref:fatty acid desaturase family protein n=1 Tax=Nitrosomonas sp. ANs5 TaxID=3423941 RepID=UPI003D35564C